MLRSLFTGISGLRAHQMMMDVTGNNIANVNTAGFKSSAVTFQDTYSQMLEAATEPQQANGVTTRGGTNPSQVGLGVRVAGMSTNFGQGATQMTGRTNDMMIDGEGLFVVKSAGETMYTRAGSFNLDAEGRLTTTEGAPVQGYMGVDGVVNVGPTGDPTDLQDIVINPKNGNSDLTAYRIDSNGIITGLYRDPDTNAVTETPIASLAIATFTNNGGLEKAGSSMYRESRNSGAVAINGPGQGANGTISTGALEMSNVDLAQEFTNLIISQRGFQANSRVITTSDELLQELVNLKR